MNATDRWADSLRLRHDPLDLMRLRQEEFRKTHEVHPVRESAPPVREKTLLDVYASDDEIASVRAVHDQIAVAEKTVTTIQTALTVVTEQIATAQRSAGGLDTDRAAAIALGEPVADLPSRSGPSLTQLQAQKIGLQHRAEAARAAAAECKGNFHAAVFDLVRQCAVRCAQDFYDLTNQHAWCWLQLDIAQSLTGTSRHHLVDLMTWNKYLVPGSEHVEVLKRHSRVEFGHPILMSADGLRASASPALKALQAHGEALFGDWPL